MNGELPMNVFLASPGDTSLEREVVQRVVDEWNAGQGSSDRKFALLSSEQRRGTARRPQEAINELVAESHYLIALFKGRWGSNSGSSWGYTSGTEEELFQGLLELGQQDQPMRDVWVCFVDQAAKDAQIEALREQMIARHAIYFEVVSDVRELKDKLTHTLTGWAADASPKRARHVELVSSTGSEALRAARLRVEGEKLVDLGQAGAGLSTLEEAARIGGPLEKLTLARHLRRQGQLELAFKAAQVAIDTALSSDQGLFSSLAAEAFAVQAAVMRRRGDDRGALGRFEQALTLVTEDDPLAVRVRCRLLDQVGIVRQSLNDVAGARQALEEAMETRRTGTAAELGQSLVNLARLEVHEGNIDRARKLSDEAMATVRHTAPIALHANVELLAAQVRLRQAELPKATAHAQRAVSLNRQFGNLAGEAMALNVLAQCYRRAGDVASAVSSAEECLLVNERMGDEQGIVRARVQLEAARARLAKPESDNC